MGQNVSELRFRSEEFRRFEQSLHEETELLTELIADRELSDGDYVIGLELEMCLIDQQGNPAALNDSLLAKLNAEEVVPELSQFNIEFNVEPTSPRRGGIAKLATRLSDTWSNCNQAAQELDLSVLSIGVLPTLREDHLVLENMSQLHRFHALNEQILRLRRGKAVRLNIEGIEALTTEHMDVMLEAGATSLQLHLQIPQNRAADAFNFATVLSAPMVAISANSPYVFGRQLWEESRIPLFEQSVAIDEPINRVNFGTGYATRDLSTMFEENQSLYPILLPVNTARGIEKLDHLRLHNGTIWRWNRPIIGFDPNGKPHLRIEHRVMAAGPTVIDMTAQMALFYGMMIDLLNMPRFDVRERLPFIAAWNNFYDAARSGLKAHVSWLDGKKWPLQKLIVQEIVPAARRGLESLQCDASDIDRWLAIITERAETGRTGAQWQTKFYQQSGGDTRMLVNEYRARQQSGEPVHQWSL